MRARLVSVCTLLLLAIPCLAGAAPATARVDVSPTRVDLDPRHRSALVDLRNNGDSVLRFEVSAHGWSLDEAGETTLTDSREIALFPSIVELAPGASRAIRIGIAQLPRAGESSYRILVRQLPPLQSEREAGAGIRVLTNFSIPVFASAGGGRAQPTLDAIALEGSQLTFTLRNTGDRSLRAVQVVARGVGPAGESLFENEAPGWYVLAHGARRFEVEVPRAACSRLRKILLEAQIAGAPPVHLERPLSCGR